MKKTIAFCTVLFLLAGCFGMGALADINSVNIWGNTDAATCMLPLVEEIFSAISGEDKSLLYQYGSFTMQSHAYWWFIYEAKKLIFVPAMSNIKVDFATGGGKTFEVYPIAMDAIVLINNEKSGVSAISQHDLQGIYGGTIDNWSDLGGNDLPIFVSEEPFGIGTYELFHKYLYGTFPADMWSDDEPRSRYDNAENAIGYARYTYMQDLYAKEKIQVLSVDGVFPSKDTIMSGAYPFTMYYYAIIHSDLPETSPEREIIDFIRSEEGQALVEKAGYIPLSSFGEEGDHE
jgi:ABC-type phosphate transport system, periplasmic component